MEEGRFVSFARMNCRISHRCKIFIYSRNFGFDRDSTFFLLFFSLFTNKQERFTIPVRGKLKRNMAGYGNSRSTIVKATNEAALGKTFNSISRLALSRPVIFRIKGGKSRLPFQSSTCVPTLLSNPWKYNISILVFLFQKFHFKCCLIKIRL